MPKKKVTKQPIKVVRQSIRSSFDVASTTPDNYRHWSAVDYLSPDSEARHDVRRTIRSRARYEIGNNSYAKGLVSMLANDTIGTGPRVQCLLEDDSLNDIIDEAFSEWADEQKLSQKLRLMRIARCQDGETFAILGTNPKQKNNVKLKVDVIEADRIEAPYDSNVYDDSEIDGIKYDKYGNPVSYRILKYHP